MYQKTNYKKAFSIIELILILSILTFISYSFIPKYKHDNLKQASKRLILYLKQTRLKAFIDDKYSHSNDLWHKTRWTLKFFRCRKDVGGIYYSIYSNKNMSGHPSASDSLKDPLSKKNIYSSNLCKENLSNSKYVLLTKQYGITSVNLSCNNTSSLGQISFGSDGRVYNKLSNENKNFFEYSIEDKCFLEMSNEIGEKVEIVIEPITGYIYENN